MLAPLFAYLDPGTGSIVLQVVVAAVLSAGVYFRQYVFAPFSMFGGKKEAVEEAPENVA